MHGKRIDIRWRDLDAYGHVNQAVYLTFAEEVLDDWFRMKLGHAQGLVWDYWPGGRRSSTAASCGWRIGRPSDRPSW